MGSEIIVALVSLAGTVIGSLTGVIMANKLSLFRIEQLEKKVDQLNALVERLAVLERDMLLAFREIDDIKGGGQ